MPQHDVLERRLGERPTVARSAMRPPSRRERRDRIAGGRGAIRGVPGQRRLPLAPRPPADAGPRDVPGARPTAIGAPRRGVRRCPRASLEDIVLGISRLPAGRATRTPRHDELHLVSAPAAPLRGRRGRAVRRGPGLRRAPGRGAARERRALERMHRPLEGVDGNLTEGDQGGLLARPAVRHVRRGSPAARCWR